MVLGEAAKLNRPIEFLVRCSTKNEKCFFQTDISHWLLAVKQAKMSIFYSESESSSSDWSTLSRFSNSSDLSVFANDVKVRFLFCCTEVLSCRRTGLSITITHVFIKER